MKFQVSGAVEIVALLECWHCVGAQFIIVSGRGISPILKGHEVKEVCWNSRMSKHTGVCV